MPKSAPAAAGALVSKPQKPLNQITKKRPKTAKSTYPQAPFAKAAITGYNGIKVIHIRHGFRPEFRLIWGISTSPKQALARPKNQCYYGNVEQLQKNGCEI